MAKSILPFREILDTEIYMRHGYAMSEWANIEDALLMVFLRFHPPNTPGIIISAMFHTPISAQVRIDLVNNVANFLLRKTAHLQEWEKLNARCNKRLSKRNMIAHMTVLHDDNDPTKSVLRPGLLDVVRTNMGVAKTTFNAKQLQAVGTSFNRLARDLKDFAQQIPPYAELVPDPKK